MSKKQEFAIYIAPPQLCAYWLKAGNNKKSQLGYFRPKKNFLEHDKTAMFDLAEKGVMPTLSGGAITLCEECNACVNIRMNTSKYLIRNSDLKKQKQIEKLAFFEHDLTHFSTEHYQLLQHYINVRHRDVRSDLLDLELATYKDIVTRATNNFITLRAKSDAELLAMAFLQLDQNRASIDLVTYKSSPELQRYSLGSVMMNKVFMTAKATGIDHVYLGSWVKDSPKLNYKARYQGLETIINGEWVDFDETKHITGQDPRPWLKAEGLIP